MAFAFDTLGYAKKLREHGIPQDQAEAHAEAAREFIMAELVTKLDLSAATTSLRQELSSSAASLRQDLSSSVASLRQELSSSAASLRQEIDAQTLRLTVRTGVMLAAGLSLMTALLGALIRFH